MKFFYAMWITLACAAVVARGNEFAEWEWRMPMLLPGYADVTLADFPALVRLPPEVTENLLERGMDLRVVDVDGNALNYDIDTWNPKGETLVWVCVPRLTQNTLLTVYWGNANAWTQDPAMAWENGFVGVWHFNEKENRLKNSTGPGLVATRHGSGLVLPGVIGNAQAWNNSWIRVYDDPALNLQDTFTVSGWFKMGDNMPRNSPWRFFGHKRNPNGNAGWEIEKDSDSYDRIGLRGIDSQPDFLTMPDDITFEETPREWRHITVQFEGSRGALFVDGVKADEANLGLNTAGDIACDLGIGASARGDAQWRGMIDEVRLESAIRPDAWIRAAYDTVVNTNFVLRGTPEPNHAAGFAMVADKIGETSATLLGWHVDGQPATLHWGAADAGDDPAKWAHTAQPAATNPLGVLSFPLRDLARDTRYFGRLRTDAGWVTATTAFTTLPAPVPILGRVTITSAPDTGTVFNVRVRQLPHNPVLTLDAGGKRQTFTPVTGRNYITFPGLPRATPLHYKLTFSGDSGTIATNAPFHVAYTSEWITSPAKTNMWTVTNNWTRGVVPNAPCDSATLVKLSGTYLIDGLKTLTLGHLELAGTNWRNLIVTANDATRIIFDNGAEPALIHVSDGAWSLHTIATSVHLKSSTRVRVDPGPKYPLTLDGDISGPGTLLLEKGGIRLQAPSNTIRRITVPIIAGNANAFIHKRGSGDVILRGNTHSVTLAERAANPLPLLADGGRLILDGAIVTNLNPSGSSFLFGSANNHLILTNSAAIISNQPLRLSCYAGTNTVTVHNSTLILPAADFNAVNNKLLVNAGATVATLNDLKLSGSSNLIAISGPASTLDLRGKTFRLDGTGNHLLVNAGGSVTNGHIIASPGNSRITLDGGRAHLASLSLQPGNSLALRAARVPAVTIAGNVDFPSEAILIPSNPAKLTGALPLLTAVRIIRLPTLDHAPIPGASLKLSDDETTLLLVIP